MSLQVPSLSLCPPRAYEAVYVTWMHFTLGCGVVLQNNDKRMTQCWSNACNDCALQNFVSLLASPPLNTHVRMCRCMHQISALILSSCSVCLCKRPCMLVCLCDLAFCLSAALQSTSCILTQSLRHKWEHQNLSAVLHTAVPRGRQREGGRWGRADQFSFSLSFLLF